MDYDERLDLAHEKELILNFEAEDKEALAINISATSHNIYLARELFKHYASQNEIKAAYDELKMPYEAAKPTPDEIEAFIELAANCEDFIGSYNYYKEKTKKKAK